MGPIDTYPEALSKHDAAALILEDTQPRLQVYLVGMAIGAYFSYVQLGILPLFETPPRPVYFVCVIL